MCVLLQEWPEVPAKAMRPWSRSLDKAEQAYETGQRECLPVVREVLPLIVSLEGSRFTIHMDHSML